MAGLDSTGFSVKNRETIQEELRLKLEQRFLALGETINTNPSSRFGQLIDIFSDEVYLVWQGLEDVYNSYFPLTSTGTSLDKAASLTNVARLDARSSKGQVYLIGDANTAVSQTSAIKVSNSTNAFVLSSKTLIGTPDLTDYVISDSVNAITFDLLAEAGTIDLRWDAENVTINYNDTAAQIKTKIETHSKISSVEVLGDLTGTEFGLNFGPGFIQIKLLTTSLTSNSLSLQNNTLTNTSINGVATSLSLSANYCSADPANVMSEQTGEIRAIVGSLVEPRDVIAGWDSAFNVEAATLGRAKETDAEFRIRRYEELSRTGTATANGIKESVYTAISSDIYNVSIIENDTDEYVAGAVSPNEMPPHSIEVFVNAPNEASTNNAIAQAIYDAKPVGIQVVSTDTGSRTGLYTDVNGLEGQIMPISSTVDVPIYIIVERTKTAAYPTGGDDQIKVNLVNYFYSLTLGDDVYEHRLFTPVNAVGGMSEVAIYLGTSSNPTTSNNIVIDPYQLATLQLENIIVRDI